MRIGRNMVAPIKVSASTSFDQSKEEGCDEEASGSALASIGMGIWKIIEKRVDGKASDLGKLSQVGRGWLGCAMQPLPNRWLLHPDQSGQ